MSPAAVIDDVIDDAEANYVGTAAAPGCGLQRNARRVQHRAV